MDVLLQRELSPLVEGLKHGLAENLWGLVLFGSVARGEAKESSDLDLLLVADSLPEKFTTRMRYLRGLLLGELRGLVSFIAKTRAEFEAGFPSYYLDLALDGIVLYDRENYMHQKLARIRELMTTAGLKRQCTDDGFSWEWQKPPEVTGASIGVGYMDSEQDVRFRLRLAEGFLLRISNDWKNWMTP